MLKAKSKNRVVRIPDEKAAEYKKLGYTLTDMNGNVIFEPENPEKEVTALKAENATLKERVSELEAKMAEAEQYAQADDEKIEALEAENADLKAKLSELEAKKTTAKKATAKATAEK